MSRCRECVLDGTLNCYHEAVDSNSNTNKAEQLCEVKACTQPATYRIPVRLGFNDEINFCDSHGRAAKLISAVLSKGGKK